MSGYCDDCGNTLCICDEDIKLTYPLRVRILELEKKLGVAVEALESIAYFDEPITNTTEYWHLKNITLTKIFPETMARDTRIARKALSKIKEMK
jgi:hypothetical protein